jgi:hypothetical protein
MDPHYIPFQKKISRQNKNFLLAKTGQHKDTLINKTMSKNSHERA